MREDFWGECRNRLLGMTESLPEKLPWLIQKRCPSQLGKQEAERNRSLAGGLGGEGVGGGGNSRVGVAVCITPGSGNPGFRHEGRAAEIRFSLG